MDFEAPLDAWYVWFGVALLSVVLFALVVGLPTEPPPDADQAANTVDRVAGSTQQAQASYDHDADEIRVDTTRISLRNEGGTDHASLTFGPVIPVQAVTDVLEAATTEQQALGTAAAKKEQALERLAGGESLSSVRDDIDVTEMELLDAVETTQQHLEESGAEWQPAEGTLHVRTLEFDGTEVALLVV